MHGEFSHVGLLVRICLSIRIRATKIITEGHFLDQGTLPSTSSAKFSLPERLRRT